MRDSCCPCLGNVLACFCGCEDMIVNSFAHFSPCVVFFFCVFLRDQPYMFRSRCCCRHRFFRLRSTEREYFREKITRGREKEERDWLCVCTVSVWCVLCLPVFLYVCVCTCVYLLC